MACKQVHLEPPRKPISILRPFQLSLPTLQRYKIFINIQVIRLIYNYSILIKFNSFYLFFNFLFLRRKNVVNFNINYLHIPNIVAVAISFSFDIVIHFINYLCLNRFILVFIGIILISYLFIYVLRVHAYYTKIFFNIQIYFCCFLIFFAVSL